MKVPSPKLRRRESSSIWGDALRIRLTVYDEEHTMTYWRLLDANAEGADWREVSRIVLGIDPDREPKRARQAFETHLECALWIANSGYRQLLRGGPSKAS